MSISSNNINIGRAEMEEILKWHEEANLQKEFGTHYELNDTESKVLTIIQSAFNNKEQQVSVPIDYKPLREKLNSLKFEGKTIRLNLNYQFSPFRRSYWRSIWTKAMEGGAKLDADRSLALFAIDEFIDSQGRSGKLLAERMNLIVAKGKLADFDIVNLAMAINRFPEAKDEILSHLRVSDEVLKELNTNIQMNR